jgi:hypothetical protein
MALSVVILGANGFSGSALRQVLAAQLVWQSSVLLRVPLLLGQHWCSRCWSRAGRALAPRRSAATTTISSTHSPTTSPAAEAIRR